ncbi:hypothetical protein [Rhodoferax sp.]|uniref:hypothetical protein n=1 Tax=Rhodoferax sp. TaxID=50421 RepID=UPI00283D4697|nr:hypothetical protein [Rhodoferax sp.]MDR3371945.1 hypothetical protein [Rhodoferax sp.]
MNQLQAELQRLYLPHNLLGEGQNLADAECHLIDANGRVRAMVVQVSQLAGWSGVAALWQGVQNELGLPSPAIAVSGIDGYQVWFSLQEPVLITQAVDFLESLRLRYLAEVAPRHLVLMPMVDAWASAQARHARLVPALQAETGHWSAFIAPGLVSMFAEEPWLDLPPSSEAQAKLLSNVESIQPTRLRQAQERLQPARAAVAHDSKSPPADRTGDNNIRQDATLGTAQEAPDPRRFLLSVMNDPAIELRLRIEAAKALLPYDEAPSQS